MMFIAHRGESYDAPENTLAAINLAWQRNADAVEVDVHLSKDDKIVVIHENNTGKFTGELRKVKDQTLEELQRIDVGKYKGNQWIDERIPTLEQVLVTVPDNKYLFIEIKCGAEILKELKSVTTNSKLQPAQIKLIGFDRDVMTNAKQDFPQNEVFWVNNIKQFENLNSWQPEIARIINEAKQAGLDGLDFSASKIIDKALVNLVKSAGMKVYVWTVNDPTEAMQLIEADVDGITTDRPQWVKAQLGNQVIG
jgi:glycerophosphoryl diester phosphodiesterase